MITFKKLSKLLVLAAIISLISACDSTSIEGSITDQSSPAISKNKFNLSSSSYTVNEGQSILITISRSNSTGTASVELGVTDITAVSTSDYLGLVSQFIEFQDGVSRKTLNINIVDDSEAEDEELFQLELMAPSNNSEIGSTAITRITIVDNDPAASPVETNIAPTISGLPKSSIEEGALYTFTPVSSDINSDPLSFTITNKPGWASFNSTTGELTGTPTNEDTGLSSGIVISVSDGSLVVSLPAFAITVININTPPTISGLPKSSIEEGALYTFTPVSSDINSDPLSFTITNKPGWASFNSTTGVLTGTPNAGDIGVTPDIVISVTDGNTIVALPAFVITVTQITYGSVTLHWTAPVENDDGTVLTDLTGYKIRYGTDQNNLQTVLNITNIGLADYVIDNLPTGKTYYFVITAYNSNNTESKYSNTVIKTM